MPSKYGNCMHLLKTKNKLKKVLFTNQVGKNSPYFVGVFNKTNSTHACWIRDDYSQLGAMRLIGYLLSHIRRGARRDRCICRLLIHTAYLLLVPGGRGEESDNPT